MLRALSSLDPRGRYVIVVRHAERGWTPQREIGSPSGWTRPLTPNGRKSAREFGERLPAFHRLTLAYSSVPRCRQTALEIAIGFGRTHRSAEIRLRGIDERLSRLRLRASGPAALDVMRERGWLARASGGRAPSSSSARPRASGRAVPDAVAAALLEAYRDPPGSLRILVGHRVGVFRISERVFGPDALGRRRIRFLDGVVFRLGPDETVTAMRHGRRRRMGDLARRGSAVRGP
jgi:broad specificity phosphatase PhoE